MRYDYWEFSMFRALQVYLFIVFYHNLISIDKNCNGFMNVSPITTIYCFAFELDHRLFIFQFYSRKINNILCIGFDIIIGSSCLENLDHLTVSVMIQISDKVRMALKLMLVWCWFSSGLDGRGLPQHWFNVFSWLRYTTFAPRGFHQKPGSLTNHIAAWCEGWKTLKYHNYFNLYYLYTHF